MIFVLKYQIVIIVLVLLLGTTVSIFLLFTKRTQQTWRVVDLIWIVFGGVGAGTAFFVSLYLTDVSNTQASINLLKSKISNLHDASSIASSRYCSRPPSEFLPFYITSSHGTICSAFEGMASETSRDSSAFDFIDLLNENNNNVSSPKTVEEILNALKGPSPMSVPNSEVLETENQIGNSLEFSSLEIGMSVFWSFDVKDILYQNAALRLKESGIHSELAFEFFALKSQFIEITSEFEKMENTWDEIRQQRWWLFVRTLSLTMIAFCLPLRIGKSIHEITKWKNP